MSIENLARNARVLIRADGIIAEVHLRTLLAKAGLQVIGALVGVFGLVMLGIAAFLAIEEHTGPIGAALIVGVGALVVAFVLAAVGGRLRPGRELEVAHGLREAATEAMMVDLKVLELEVRGLAGAVRRPLDGALVGMVLPLATLLLKTLRRSSPPQRD